MGFATGHIWCRFSSRVFPLKATWTRNVNPMMWIKKPAKSFVPMDRPTKISLAALIIAVLTGIFGAFGGIPGIRDVFFSEPKLVIEAFMPSVVYDAGNTKDTIHPKFTLKGVLKVLNTNNFDINLAEMKSYGMTKDSSGKNSYKGKPVFYELNVAGLVEPGGGVIKAYSSGLVKFSFAHFDNDRGPNIMNTPMKGGYSDELGSLLFHIYLPSFNQMFNYNNNRVPYELVPETKNGQLSFAVSFNNELIKINPKQITSLVSFTKDEWEDNDRVSSLLNATANLAK